MSGDDPPTQQARLWGQLVSQQQGWPEVPKCRIHSERWDGDVFLALFNDLISKNADMEDENKKLRMEVLLDAALLDVELMDFLLCVPCGTLVERLESSL